MKTHLKDYPDILRHYLRRSQEIVFRHQNPIVLKTDSFNEAKNLPMVGGIAGNIVASSVVVVEIDPPTVLQAAINLNGLGHISVDKGDIRKLELNDEIFDVILDLSTLDHIWPDELPQAIGEYNRVLKPGGTILLIVWVDTHRNYSLHRVGGVGQCLLGYDQVRTEIDRYFKIESEQTIYQEPGRPDHPLKEFILKK